jgi:hypothetical protein
MNPLLQFDSPRKIVNDPANNDGKVLQTTPRVQLGAGLVATLEPAAPQPGEVQIMRLDTTISVDAALAAAEAAQAAADAAQGDVNSVAANLTTLQGTVAAQATLITNLQTAVADLQTAVATLALVAVPGGLWTMPDVVTTDTTAVIGELVRVDMAGKATPDIVVVTLPESNAGNEGRAICVATTNADGAGDGAILRVVTTGGQLISSGVGAVLNSVGEVRLTFVSNGAGWDLQSSP